MRNKRDGHIFGRTDPIVPTEPWESECSYISVYGTIKCGVPPPPPPPPTHPSQELKILNKFTRVDAGD